MPDELEQEQVKEEIVQEPTVPLHQHTELRGRAQQAEVANARLQGQIDAMTAQQATEAPAAISPLDAEIARQKAEGIADEDMSISPAIIKADKLFDQQVENQAAEAAAANDLVIMQGASAVRSRLVHDDYDQVIHDGENLLNKYQKAEVLDAGKDFGQVSYDMCKAAIEASKPAPKSSEPEPEPKEEPEPKKEEVPSQESILSNVSLQTMRVQNL